MSYPMMLTSGSTYTALPSRLVKLSKQLDALGGDKDIQVAPLETYIRIFQSRNACFEDDKETGPGEKSRLCVEGNVVVSPTVSVSSPTNSKTVKKFPCTRAFDENHSDSEVSDFVSKRLIDGLWRGFNGTLVTYGPSETGKSGILFKNCKDGKYSIVGKALNVIYRKKSESSLPSLYEVGISMWKVTGTVVLDLLTKEQPQDYIEVPSNENTSPQEVERLYKFGFVVCNDLRTALAVVNVGLSHDKKEQKGHLFLRIILKNIKDGNASSLHIVDLVGFEGFQGSKKASLDAMKSPLSSRTAQENRNQVKKDLLNFRNLVSDMAEKEFLQSHERILTTRSDTTLGRMIARLFTGNTKISIFATISQLGTRMSAHEQRICTVENLQTLKFIMRASSIHSPCSRKLDINSSEMINIQPESLLHINHFSNTYKIDRVDARSILSLSQKKTIEHFQVQEMNALEENKHDDFSLNGDWLRKQLDRQKLTSKYGTQEHTSCYKDGNDLKLDKLTSIEHESYLNTNLSKSLEEVHVREEANISELEKSFLQKLDNMNKMLQNLRSENERVDEALQMTDNMRQFGDILDNYSIYIAQLRGTRRNEKMVLEHYSKAKIKYLAESLSLVRERLKTLQKEFLQLNTRKAEWQYDNTHYVLHERTLQQVYRQINDEKNKNQGNTVELNDLKIENDKEKEIVEQLEKQNQDMHDYIQELTNETENKSKNILQLRNLISGVQREEKKAELLSQVTFTSDFKPNRINFENDLQLIFSKLESLAEREDKHLIIPVKELKTLVKRLSIETKKSLNREVNILESLTEMSSIS